MAGLRAVLPCMPALMRTSLLAASHAVDGAVCARLLVSALPWQASTHLVMVGLPLLQVVQVKTKEGEGYTALQLGAGAKRAKQLRGTQRGHYDAVGELAGHVLRGCRIAA